MGRFEAQMTGNQREVGFGLIIGARMVDLEGIREGELDTAFRQVLQRLLCSLDFLSPSPPYRQKSTWNFM